MPVNDFSVAHDTFDSYPWRIDVKNWVIKRKNATPELAEDMVRFFECAFQETQCPEHTWFGVHKSVVSLVVGSIFLASIVPSGTDRGLWLLVDQDPPLMDGVDYRPARSTLHSSTPLVWAHMWPIKDVSKIVEADELWVLFAQASEKVFNSRRISRDQDVKQIRLGKRRLSDFFQSPEKEELAFPDEIYYEGAARQLTVKDYRRSSQARRECLDRHGQRCWVCKIDFVEKYGEAGKNCIHVHHLRPIAEIGEQHQVNPKDDLCPVCPNCHAVVHRRNPPYSIEEVRAMMRYTCSMYNELGATPYPHFGVQEIGDDTYH